MNFKMWLSIPVLLLLECNLAVAAQYANSSIDSTTTIHVTSTKFITQIATGQSSGAGATTTMGGPQVLDADSLVIATWSWIQQFFPTTIGTVQIIVNKATNKTTTSTKYHTEYKANGTGTDAAPILLRTDIDAAGTVTQVVRDLYNSSTTLTYPTSYAQYSDSLIFYGQAATIVDSQGTCCKPTTFLSSTPSHSPFASPTYEIDPSDPSGWLYVAYTGVGPERALTTATSAEITALWGYQVQLTLPQCPYEPCENLAVSDVSPATVNSQQVGVFATETTTLDIPEASTSFLVDPVAGSQASDTLPSSTKTSETHVFSTTAAAETSSSSDVSRIAASEAAATSSSIPPTQESSSVILSSHGENEQSSASNPPQPTATQQSEASLSVSLSVASETIQSVPSPIIVIGKSTVTQQSNSEFVVGSQTLAPGSSIVVGSGSSTTVVALQTNGVVVIGSSSSLIQPPQVTAPAQSQAPNIVIGDSTVTQQSDSVFIIDSQTLNPGSSITIGSGSSTTVVALQTNGVVVVGSSSSLLQPQITAPAGTQAPNIIIGDSTVTRQSDSAFIIGSQTLTPGGSVTIGSGSSTTVVALASNANSVVLQEGSSSLVIPVITAGPAVSFSTPPPAIVIGGSTITQQSGSAFIISGQTLVPGSSITVGSEVVQLQSDSSSLILQIGTSTEVVHIPSAVPISATPPAIVVGGSTITEQSNSEFIVSGQTLTPGGTITVGTGSTAETVALQTSGSHLVVVYDGTSTSTFAATQAPLPAFTFDGSVFSANSASAYVVEGQTLLPGSGIVVDGTTISLASDASELVIGTSTVEVEASTTSGGLGGFIWSAFDAESTSGASSTTSKTSGSSSASTSGSGGVTSITPGASSSAAGAVQTTTTSAGRRFGSSLWFNLIGPALLMLML